MSIIAAAVQAQVQELRAQSLATLMSAIDSIDPVAAVQRIANGQSQGGGAAFANGQSAVLAQVVAPPMGGKLMVLIAGQPLEIPLSPEMQKAIAENPGQFRPGARLALLPEMHSGTLRLVPQQAEEAAAPRPATIVALKTHAPGPSVDAAEPLPQAFPPGSAGAAIQRLTGLAFPVAEQAAKPALAGAAPHMLRAAGSTLAMLPADLAETALAAAARQSPVSTALSALAGKPELPVPLAAKVDPAITMLSSMRLDAQARPDADTINRALRQSGIFLEAGLAKGVAMPDLKSVLASIRSTLAGVDTQSTARGEAAPARADTGASRPVSRETLPPTASELGRMVEGAIERIKLNQIASLPEHPGVRITDERAQGFQITATVPLATQGLERPQTAAIGVMIEHRPIEDAARPEEADPEDDNETQGFPWKVRIALDLEETGPVQAEIALRGQTVGITLWAERAGTASLARSEIGALHAALTEAAFDVARLEVKDGRPAGEKPRVTPVVDRRS